MGLKTKQRMNGNAPNFLRCFFRNRLNVDAPFGACNEEWSAASAIEENGDIKFFGNIDGFCDENFLNKFALWPGLMCDECVAKHLVSKLDSLLWRGRNFYATLKTIS